MERGDALKGDAQRLLRTAAETIRSALLMLDTSAEYCESCSSRTRFLNADHAKIAQQLENLPARLRLAAWRLDDLKRRPNAADPLRMTIASEEEADNS